MITEVTVAAEFLFGINVETLAINAATVISSPLVQTFIF